MNISELSTLRSLVVRAFPQARVVVAGGAPRDILHSRPVKDIDVFIQLPGLRPLEWVDGRGVKQVEVTPDSELHYLWFSGCEVLCSLLGPGSSWNGSWHNQEDDSVVDSLGNSKGYGYGAFSLVDITPGWRMTPVQLVFIDIDPEENVRNHFDFGLSQVWVGEGGLRWTPAYWKDHDLHRITYTPSSEPNPQRIESSLARLARLKVKYAGWPIHREAALQTAWERVQEERRAREAEIKEAAERIIRGLGELKFTGTTTGRMSSGVSLMELPRDPGKSNLARKVMEEICGLDLSKIEERAASAKDALLWWDDRKEPRHG